MEINLFNLSEGKIYFSKRKVALLITITGAVLAFGFFIVNTSDTNALNTCNEGYRVNVSSSKTIDCRNKCRVVSNSGSGESTFVPTRYLAQWNSFINNPPGAISFGSCSSGSSPGDPAPLPPAPPESGECSSLSQCGASYSDHSTNRCINDATCSGWDWSTSCSLICNYGASRNASNCRHQHRKWCDSSSGKYCYTTYHNKTEIWSPRSCVL